MPDYYEARSQLAGLRVVITPGPDWEEINKNIDVIPGDFAYQINLDFDPDNLPHPGPDGRMTLRNLIPGARTGSAAAISPPSPARRWTSARSWSRVGVADASCSLLRAGLTLEDRLENLPMPGGPSATESPRLGRTSASAWVFPV